jgi:uncharacterized protein YydD (DUF2326 family)
VQCSERERLESALAEMVSRLDYLTKLSHGDPSLDRLTQEIVRVNSRVTNECHRRFVMDCTQLAVLGKI